MLIPLLIASPILILVALWFLWPRAVAISLLALERARSGLRSHYVQAGGYRWHYLDGARNETNGTDAMQHHQWSA